MCNSPKDNRSSNPQNNKLLHIIGSYIMNKLNGNVIKTDVMSDIRSTCVLIQTHHVTVLQLWSL